VGKAGIPFSTSWPAFSSEPARPTHILPEIERPPPAARADSASPSPPNTSILPALHYFRDWFPGFRFATTPEKKILFFPKKRRIKAFKVDILSAFKSPFAFTVAVVSFAPHNSRGDRPTEPRLCAKAAVCATQTQKPKTYDVPNLERRASRPRAACFRCARSTFLNSDPVFGDYDGSSIMWLLSRPPLADSQNCKCTDLSPVKSVGIRQLNRSASENACKNNPPLQTPNAKMFCQFPRAPSYHSVNNL